MVHVTIKDGVWRNTEDEILKATGMKLWQKTNGLEKLLYFIENSLNNVKLVVRFEWLDPSIKKTEWSRGEDEKLLHMAKLMPAQWRIIPPIVQHTAAQFLELFAKLIFANDQVQCRREGLDETTYDLCSLHPSEIDSNSENKPANPGRIDMDEDEIEMLSEVRTRLANTKVKKIKRKAREKQLEKDRHLASLQKHRKLRAASIEIHRSFNKKPWC